MASKTATITVELVDGTKVVVPDSLNHISSYVLQEQGDWFEDEIKFLRGLVKSGDTVLDIGSNYGVYALSLARKVGSTGQVWAFEPATETAQMLSESVATNSASWLIVEQKALSDHQGTAWLQMPGQSELNSLASPELAASDQNRGPGEDVPVTTLDFCLEHFGWSAVDVLKIDAEGEEERILRGGKRFFNQLSPLVMFEVKAGLDLHLDLVRSFQDLGYRCFRLIPGLDVLAPFHPDQGVDGYLLNLFAAKPDRVSSLVEAGKLAEGSFHFDLDEDVTQGSSWLGCLENLPYGRILAPQWRTCTDQQEQKKTRLALAALSLSRDSAQPTATRYGALVRSFQWLREQCCPGCRPSRWASLARVALELGERDQSMQAIRELLKALQSEGDLSLDEPFLSPHPAFDAVDPAGQLRTWLEAACWEAYEMFGSFSGFFTGASALPRLERIVSLGFASKAVLLRLHLLKQRFASNAESTSNIKSSEQAPLSSTIEEKEIEPSSSVRDWFHFLRLEQPLRCIDVGALGLKGEPDPWVRWAEEGCAEVIGFEPLQDECERLNQQATEAGLASCYLPWALGDGNEHTLYITNEPMTSSLFPPARSTIDLFPALGELMQVVKRQPILTRRLDDFEEAQMADFLKLDIQGAELMVLQNAETTLRRVAVVQCEVEFVELYEGQPLMADVDSFLRSQGFTFLRFVYLMGRPFKPLQISETPYESISQSLWGDAVYVRDFRKLSDWSNHQLKSAIFLLHELYGAFDLAAFLLNELDRRCETSLNEAYLSSLLLSNCSLTISLP